MSAAGAAGDALEIEIVGTDDGALEAAVRATLARLNVSHGHVAIEIVDAARISELNGEYRANPEPTDVLSFPVDGESVAAGAGKPGGAPAAPLELGDVVICPQHTADMVEAAVHGVLHLCGFDHETDDGEMLALQDEITAELALTPPESMS